MPKSVRSLLFLLLLICRAALAVEVKGSVQSISGKPIPDAVVLHRASGAKTQTGQDGTFVLEVGTRGKVILEAVHADYLDGEFLISPAGLLKPVVLVLTPYIRQTEEVTVTALRYPEPTTKVPAAMTIVETKTLEDGLAPNITEALNTLPGVAPLGSGGFSLVPSIRGLARGRILVLADSARVVSDRRTGPSASFISPEDIDRIEVLRSPSSIFYGSDAVGGVVHIFTKSAPENGGLRGNVHLAYGAANEQKSHGLSLSGAKNGLGFYVSYQNEDASDYRSPQGFVPYSRFSQGSLFGKLTWRTSRREVEASFLGARGIDIGKPNKNSAAKPTWYPRENQNLAHIRWTEKRIAGGDLIFNAFFNPNFLETKTQRIKNSAVTQETSSRTEGTDFGLQLGYGREFGGSFRLSGGADFFGRSGVGAVNNDAYFDSGGNTTQTISETPYSAGRRSDFGLYLSADFGGIDRVDLVGGVRWDRISQEARPGGGPTPLEYRYDAFTGFLAASYRLTGPLMAFANASRAYRAPGLSELFYTGVTGRGFIIANPNLDPEVSANFDLGLKWISNRVFAAVYGFSYRIDGFIDRYLVAESTYTYGNVDDGRIQGIEVELEIFPLTGWKVFGNVASMKGTSAATGARLNDIPPLRAHIGTKVWVRKLSLEFSGILQGRKDTPGPAEVAISGFAIFGFKASYDFGRLTATLNAGNIFDEYYFGRPDPEAMEEPGRNIVVGLRYSF